MSKFGSRRSRTLGSFHFGFGASNGASRQDTVVEETGRVEARGDAKGSAYALNRLSSVDSANSVMKSSEDQAERKASMQVSVAPRTSCTRTATRSLNEPVEAEPKHCLAHAK